MKFITAIMAFLLLSAPAFCYEVISVTADAEAVSANKDASAFEFPPPATAPEKPTDPVPAPVEPAPPADADKAGFKDWGPEDWSAFLQNFIVPLVTLLVGLFGGGIGVRLKDRWSRNKEQKQTDLAEVGRIMSMLSKYVPELHGKVVVGDRDAKKREAALAKAKEALDEVVNNGV